MSFIVAYRTKSLVFVAGDRRNTYVDGSNRYEDNCKKVFKANDFIFGISGSGALCDLFVKKQ